IHEVEPPKLDEGTHFRDDPDAWRDGVSATEKVLPFERRGNRPGGVFGVDSTDSLLQDDGRDIGCQDAKAKTRMCLGKFAQDDTECVRLLAGRASRAPDQERMVR